MKKSIWIGIPILYLQATYAQTKSNLFVAPTNHKHIYYVEIQEHSGVVFKLAKWMDKAGTGNTIVFTDTLQPNASGYVYVGESTKLEKEQDKLYLIVEEDISHKLMRIEVDTVEGQQA